MTILTLLNPFGWFGNTRAKLSGGSQPGQQSRGAMDNATGRPVSPDAAMTLSTYWACVKLIGQTIGTLPMELFNQDAAGGRTPAVEDPLWDLLHDQPNADLTAVEFWEGVGACLAVWGNFYAEKRRIGARLVALEPLKPFWMEPFRGGDGRIVYRYRENGTVADFDQDDVFHVRGFGFGGIVGLTPIAYARQPLATALAAQDTAAAMFRNGMRVSGWFRYKGGVLTPEQREQTKIALIDPYVGADNAAKVGILPSDFDWVQTTMNASDAQLLEQMRFGVEDVCRGFGVPPVMVGHAGQGQTMWGSGVEQIVLGFLTTGLRPYLHRIEAAIGRDLIGRARRQTVRAAFNVEELLRGDNKGRALVDSQLANAGIQTRNELRAGRNLPPLPGGDTLTVQSALLPIEMLGLVARLPSDQPVEPGADVEPADGDPATPTKETA